MTSPARMLAALWPFALLFCLYSAKDVHAWLAWDEDSTRFERRLGRAVLSAGRESGFVAARDAIDAGLEPLREPPLLLAREAVQQTEDVTATGAAIGLPPPPRRILLAGASSIEFHFGVALERCLETYAGVEVRRVGKLGTGLARPQDFDWLAGLPKEQAAFSPDLVVGQFGGNDCRPAIDPVSGRRWQFDTPAWHEEYGRRVATLVQGVLDGGARMELLGQLAVRRPGNRRCFEQVDAATRTAAERAGASFLPLRALTLQPAGGKEEVIESVTDESGIVRRMWLRDDLHLTRAGATTVAARICPQLERRHGLENPDPALGRILRFETPSAARGRSVAWYAILPREIPAAGIPSLFLLHGGGGSAEDWMTLQEPLQRMAVTHGIAIIVPDGGAWSWWVDGLEEKSGVESFVIRELIPDAARRLPLDGRRGIAGLSMGGHGALVLAARNPGTFSSASSMSGVVDLLADPTRTGQIAALGALPEHMPRWRARSAQQLLESRPRDFARLALKLSCGDGDRFLAVNRAFHAALEERGIAHEWDQGPGGHDWSYWAATLPAHVAWHAERLRAAPMPGESFLRAP